MTILGVSRVLCLNNNLDFFCVEKPGLGWSLNLTLHLMTKSQVHGDGSPRGSAFPPGSGSQIQAGPRL